jgi:hypothetical protein
MKALAIAVAVSFLQLSVPLRSSIAVGGTILDGDSLQPIPTVSVEIQGRTAQTDLNGRFYLTDLKAGRVQLIASKDGYAIARPFRSRIAGTGGVPLTLAPFRTVEVDLRLYRTGSLRGLVTNTKGKGLPRVRVVPYRQTYDSEGKLGLDPASASQPRVRGGETNDQGEFRIYNLEPGAYALLLQPSPPMLPRYYPNVADANQARLVTVFSNTESSLEPTMIEDPAGHSISLRVLNRTGVSRISGHMFARIPGNQQPLLRVPMVFGEESTVKLGPLPPALYNFEFFSDLSFAQGVPFMIAKEIPLQLYEGASAELVLTKSRRLYGQVMFSNQTPFGDASIDITHVGTPARRGISLKTSIDGRFYLESLPSGLYSVRSPNLASDVCLQKVHSGERNVMRDGLLVGDEDVSLKVVVNNAQVGVHGVVVDSSRAIVHGAFVALVPEDRSLKEAYALTRSDQVGEFVFKCAQPGSYRLFAWTELDGEAYRNEEFLEHHSDRGQLVRVGSDPVEIHLTVIESRAAERFR